MPTAKALIRQTPFPHAHRFTLAFPHVKPAALVLPCCPLRHAFFSRDMASNETGQLARLQRIVRQQLDRYRANVDCKHFQEYLELARRHLGDVRTLAPEKPTINLALAEAIFVTFERLQSVWETLSNESQAWLCAAMCYFAEPNDADEHDFESFVGFDDDVEVLNACLALAGLKEWQLNLADYD